MSEIARDRILARLRGAPRQEIPRLDVPAPAAAAPDRNARVARLKSLMETVRAEVHVLPAAEWIPRLKEVLGARVIKTLLYAPDTDLGSALAEAWQQDAAGLPELVAYAEPVESFKERLFAVDAAVTSAAGAVADTGALILRPTGAEPRLMSLVPPVHIALLRASAIVPDLEVAFARFAADRRFERHSAVTFVRGPSRTADIELQITIGVHGPRALHVVVLDDRS